MEKRQQHQQYRSLLAWETNQAVVGEDSKSHCSHPGWI